MRIIENMISIDKGNGSNKKRKHFESLMWKSLRFYFNSFQCTHFTLIERKMGEKQRKCRYAYDSVLYNIFCTHTHTQNNPHSTDQLRPNRFEATVKALLPYSYTLDVWHTRQKPLPKLFQVLWQKCMNRWVCVCVWSSVHESIDCLGAATKHYCMYIYDGMYAHRMHAYSAVEWRCVYVYASLYEFELVWNSVSPE